jgi:phytoene desaturase
VRAKPALRSEHLAIVGGGLAGLCAGIYAQRSGFRTTVFEAHTAPGGVCASWRRGPYLLDVGIQMLIGTAPASPFHELLEEAGIIGRVAFTDMPELQRIEDVHGERVIVYRDPDALEAELCRAGPRDRARVRRFIRTLADFARFRPPVTITPETARLSEGIGAALSLLPIAAHALRYWKMPVARWVESFESPVLRNVFLTLFGMPDFPVMAMFSALGWFTGGQVGRPALGAAEIVAAVVDAYKAAGGELRCGQAVERILVEGDRACGVRLADGSEERADVVLGAADGRMTIFDLLGGKYCDAKIESYYRELALFRPLVTLNYGLAMPITRDPQCVVFGIEPAIAAPGTDLRVINVFHTTGVPGTAPEGHCVVRVGFESEYEPWAKLAQSPERYRAAKEKLAAGVLERLDARYPGFARNVRVCDVATPITLERYTRNWKGAYEGWLPTTRTFGLTMPKKLPGLGNFYMAGQWVAPGGGIPGVLRSARTTVMVMCKDLGHAFSAR